MVVEFPPLYRTIVFYFEGVELTCRNTIHKTGDDVVFDAIPHPEIPFIVDFFYWKIDDGPYHKNIPQPKVYKFTKPGT